MTWFRRANGKWPHYISVAPNLFCFLVDDVEAFSIPRNVEKTKNGDGLWIFERPLAQSDFRKLFLIFWLSNRCFHFKNFVYRTLKSSLNVVNTLSAVLAIIAITQLKFELLLRVGKFYLFRSRNWKIAPAGEIHLCLVSSSKKKPPPSKIHIIADRVRAAMYVSSNFVEWDALIYEVEAPTAASFLCCVPSFYALFFPHILLQNLDKKKNSK